MMKKNKKGFSLVEMLVVIAIIAVLVAIIIPVIGTSTVKAAAAANAANLRSIEGRLTYMRLDHPEDFNTILATLSQGIVGDLTDGAEIIVDFIFGTGSTDHFLNERFASFTASEDGVLTLYAPDVVIGGVPAAEKVYIRGNKKYDSIDIEKGTPMTIYVTETEIAATYGDYGVEHFADIADDGKLNSTVVSGGSNEGDGLLCGIIGHNFGPDGICTVCGFDSGYHECVDNETEIIAGIAISGPDGKCDICDIPMHSTHIDENNDHMCDYNDGARLSDCDQKQATEDAANHFCSMCGKNPQPHVFSANGECYECGRLQHDQRWDCKDSLDEGHDCDVCGRENITACEDGDTNHLCDHNCGNDAMGGACTLGSNKKSIGNNQHATCTYCKEDAENCVDSGADQKKGDHKCDACGGTTSECQQSLTGGCDICGKGSSISECVTPDTLITLADGTQKRVDELTGDEMLLVWNMETGALDAAPIMFVDSEPSAEYNIIHLIFSDGTEVKIIGEHGFWDYDLNRYVYLDANAEQYIGHSFFKLSGNGGVEVELVGVVKETVVTTAWSPVTVGHLCYFVDGMLSMPGGVGGLFNIFDVDAETMTYDYAAMARDIETYGLFTYEELSSYIDLSEDMFNAAGGQYLKISIGKGNMTEDELFAMINRYAQYFE